LNEEILIVKKDIKNLYLRVDSSCKVRLSTPKRLSCKRAHDFIKKNEEWIKNRVKECKKRQKKQKESLFYLGNEYKIVLIESENKKVELKDSSVCIYSKNGKHFWLLEEWKKQKAHEVFKKYIKKYEKLFDLEVKAVRIRPMRTKWGSCNYKKMYINLNLYLIHKSLNAIESVILHEFAHFFHPNHSKEFYSFIYNIMPEYKKYELELKGDL
jgi:predicted metal-dependent hydrolase